MKTIPTRKSPGYDFEARRFPRTSFSDYYLTGSVKGGERSIQVPERIFSRVASFLAESGGQIVQEKIYGLRGAYREIMALRRKIYQKHTAAYDTPVTYIEGRSIDNSPFAGLQIWAVSPKKRPESAAVVTVENAARVPGRLVRGPGFRMMYLSAVNGSTKGAARRVGGVPGAEAMFKKAQACVENNGFSFRNVVRTWIYLPRLLEDYDDFNGIRAGFYRRMGLSDSVENFFPASTGIQGRGREGMCFMDLLAVDGRGSRGVRVTPILETARQGDPFQYGSAFVRGMAVDIEGGRTVYVSGTASIDKSGKTLHAGDPMAQSRVALEGLVAVLERAGCGPADIFTATVFCKNAESFHAFRKVLREQKRATFPSVCVLADICRPELLVEIEAVALSPDKRQTQYSD